jgi:AraC-like DNA-binding protein
LDWYKLRLFNCIRDHLNAFDILVARNIRYILEKTGMNTYSVLDYRSIDASPRSKVSLQQNLISFLDQGEKVVYYANEKTVITAQQFAILSSGNCLMTEKLPQGGSYRSVMIFFSDSAISSFFIKYASSIERTKSISDNLKKPFVVFEKDEFITTYITSLKFLQSKPKVFQQQLIALKFEELMLHLLEKYPGEILSFQTKSHEVASDIQIRKAVELNLKNNLKLEELAFLCNVSASTFKRKFVKLYNETPARYFLRKKMEIAKVLLLENANPIEVYYQVGYESHSSFSQSFKQMYGLSPKDFKQQYLIDSKQLLTDQR